MKIATTLSNAGAKVFNRDCNEARTGDNPNAVGEFIEALGFTSSTHAVEEVEVEGEHCLAIVEIQTPQHG